MGAMACLLVLLGLPDAEGSGPIKAAMAGIATWIFFPSLALTLVPGLLAIAVTPAFHNAGWVWLKAATGILIFEGGLVYVVGPLRGETGAEGLAGFVAAERATLWLLLAVSGANVALGVWRPRFTNRPG